MASDSVVPRARQITVRRFASAAEADRHDLEFWLQIPEASASFTRGGSARNCGGSAATGLMNPDFTDLLKAFVAADVRFLIVGAYALAHAAGRARPAIWMCGSMRHLRMPRVSCGPSLRSALRSRPFVKPISHDRV